MAMTGTAQRATMTTVLAADIGGTNCRLALCAAGAGGEIAILQSSRVPTAGMRDTASLRAAMEAAFGKERVDAAVAVGCSAAGAVTGGHVSLSNARLELDEADGRALFPGAGFAIVNDFGALALAMMTRGGREAARVLGPETRPPAGTVLGVVGAGTGFGCAALLPVPGRAPVVMPSEGGHMAFGFSGGREDEYAAFLRERRGVDILTADEVVSGRGLEALHAFLTGRELDAAGVAETALGHETEVLSWFARFYARAARDWALATMCAGGLWIAGGIAMKNPLVTRCRAFGVEFVRGAHQAFLARVPVRVFANEDCCLWGAALAALGAAPA